MVFWGMDTGFGQDSGVHDLEGTLIHSQTITGFWPGGRYCVGVRSRTVIKGKPNTFSQPTFYTSAGFAMPAAPAAGPFDYYVAARGGHHVIQGYDLYLVLYSGFVSGRASFRGGSYKIVIGGLPPFTAVHWPDQEYDGLKQGRYGTTNVSSDTLTAWGPSVTQVQVVTNVGGKTPPGSYTLKIKTTTELLDGSDGPVKDIAWTVVVDPPPSFPFGSHVAYPKIPNLGTWESWMTTYGAKWAGGPPSMDCLHPMWYESVQFYDGTRVYYNIYDYDVGHKLTKDPSKWLTAARNCNANYIRTWIERFKGGITAYSMFPEGLYMSWLREGDTGARDAIHSIAHHAAGSPLNSGGIPVVDAHYMREAAFWLNVYRIDGKLGYDTRQRVAQLVTSLLGQIDQVTVSGNAEWHQPFMDGLAAEALIAYYEDGHQDDIRIPPAIKSLADYLWTHAWNRTEYEEGAFYYNSYQYAIGMPLGANEMKGLNLMIAPMYAWLFKSTGDAAYQKRGDEIWSKAFTAKPGDTVAWSGKNFSQNYRWSFDYVRWRSKP
jgi:hypothetical protein